VGLWAVGGGGGGGGEWGWVVLRGGLGLVVWGLVGVRVSSDSWLKKLRGEAK